MSKISKVSLINIMFINSHTDGNRFELTVLNPTLVVGPLLMDGHGASITVRFKYSFIKYIYR
jgi:hypothetical protein